MKILVMTDLEGVAGVLNLKDWVYRDSRHYAKAQRLLTEEVNAAVDGFCAEGVQEIVVVDGHGAGGIDPEVLDERALLRHGPGSQIWPWGLDRSFQGVAVVGQHAKAGTPFSHLTHTEWFNCIDRRVNGVSIGEYGLLALCARELGVPMILACGEAALAGEAAELTPGVVTVSVKWGLLPDGLEHLDAEAYEGAKTGGLHVAPRRARSLIREGARQAARRLQAEPASFRWPEIRPPYVGEAWYRHQDRKPAYQTRAEHPSSLIDLLNLSWPRVKTPRPKSKQT